MKIPSLHLLERISLFLGSRPIRFFAWWIAAGYFLFFPSRRRSSVLLYRTIFPEKKGWYHYYCAWRQFQSFAATFGDRIDIDQTKGDSISTEGREMFLETTRGGRGGILLMSHLGNFEIAARGFQQYGLKHLMIMGEKEAKKVARNQREDLKARGISIQVATGEEEAFLGGLKALTFLREGGIVSLAGDIFWTRQRSLLPVQFFGREVFLTSGPHLLALVSGAPLFMLFTFRGKKGKHRVVILPPGEVKAHSRSERQEAIQTSAQRYAETLEEMIRRHPFQWYIFEPFFRPAERTGKKLEPDSAP